MFILCLFIEPIPPLLVQNNLQQLCISTSLTSRSTRDTKCHLDDNFMETASAHGGLIHVMFTVDSVTSTGVVTLIKNSPNLLSFILCEETLNESLNALLRKEFSHQKLYLRCFRICRGTHRCRTFMVETYWSFNIVALSIKILWPPKTRYTALVSLYCS